VTRDHEQARQKIFGSPIIKKNCLFTLYKDQETIIIEKICKFPLAIFSYFFGLLATPEKTEAMQTR